MKKLISTGVLVVLAATAAGCHGDASAHDRSSAPPPIDDPGAAPAWSSLAFVTAGPAAAHWTDEIPGRIVFDETRTSRLGAPLGGRVTAVSVELGQRVKTGAPLFTVTSGDLADLRVQREKAAVELATANTSLTRVQALVDAHSLPAKELVTAKQDQIEAALALKTADQKLSSLKVVGGGDSTFTLTAPRDGVVVEKTVASGQQVSPDQGALIAIADLSDVWVIADLLEDRVGAIAKGTKAEITIDGADKPVDATVDQVSEIVDPDRHTVPVRVRLDNLAGRLRPNAFVQVRFYDELPGPIALPSSAVISDGATEYVYLMKGDKLIKRQVTAGPPSGGLVPIRAGLTAGEKVVAKGATLLDNQILSPGSDDAPNPQPQTPSPASPGTSKVTP